VINKSNFSKLEDELKELNRYSKIFKKLTKPTGDTAFEQLAKRLMDMDISTIFPLMLYIEGDDEITKQHKDEIYAYLDSYLTRRFLCGLTTKNYNNVFLEYLKFLTENKEAESFKNLLKSKTAETNLWPSDNMLLEKLLERPLYREEKNRTKSISNILLEVEKHSRGKKQEKINFVNSGLTIEHILPQKWYEYWPLNGESISEDDFNISVHAVMTEDDKEGKYHQIEGRNKILHTIGNLTILTSSLNPSVSNSAFLTKKTEINSQSTLIINTYLQDKLDWDENEIKLRSKVLYNSISKIWAY
jgi:hypothetical protein